VSLRRIVLRDFVIVHELDLDLTGGFTVLTGETGAGKSILIDALQLATGGRADLSLIREGATRTEVCVECDLTPALTLWLDTAGFAGDSGLMLRRTFDTQGKSRAWINGSPATAAQLRSVGEQLLDIHGQHAWQSLTRPDEMRHLLDAYAGLSVARINALWHQWHAAQEQLQHARGAQESLQQEQDRLSWQIGELEKLAPQPDEWDRINADHARLSHAQALIEAAQAALSALDEDDESATSQLGKGCTELQKQEHIEPEFKALSEVLASSLAQTADCARTLRAYLRKTEPDPDSLNLLDQRLALWMSLARRYKRAPAELPVLLLQWRTELAALDAATDLQSLERVRDLAWQDYQHEARELSKARSLAAQQLAQAITLAMQGLGMGGGQFRVDITRSAQPLQSGLDDISFLVAGHVGSTPRPVNKVASGGELSRIALAIAVTTSQLGSSPTLIFDEVDAGVGGAVAETVGRLMHRLGVDRQVLAVTHLPQVAACADRHLVVRKQLQAGVTVSLVDLVQGEQRVTELARMLGGERILASTLAHARDMLQPQSSGYA
jgi:DNA repair protein RecN (Recombination protein N)